MAGLQGNTQGVGRDIVDYLTEVATHFDLTIVVTSGYRDASRQAKAMFDNWIHLKRGAVYAKAALPEADRERLDRYYRTALEDANANGAERSAAQAAFMKLAGERVGTRSMHTRGRAVDVTQASVPAAAYRAITRRMKEVREGRDDIYHFESAARIPKPGAADRRAWGSPPVSLQGRTRTLLAGGGVAPCNCLG